MSGCEPYKATGSVIDDYTEVAAYAFALNNAEQSGAVCGTRKSGYLQVFKTASDCRNALAVASPQVQVLITENASEVSALNLAAALNKDNELRDIYIQHSDPTGLFISRSLAAGVRGVVDRSQAQLMTRLPVSSDAAEAAPAQPANSATAFPAANPQSAPASPANLGAAYQTPTPAAAPAPPADSAPAFPTANPQPVPVAPANLEVASQPPALVAPTAPPVKSTPVRRSLSSESASLSSQSQELDWLEDYLDLAELDVGDAGDIYAGPDSSAVLRPTAPAPAAPS